MRFALLLLVLALLSCESGKGNARAALALGDGANLDPLPLAGPPDAATLDATDAPSAPDVPDAPDTADANAATSDAVTDAPLGAPADVPADVPAPTDVPPPECTTAPDCDYLSVGNPCKVPQCKGGLCGFVNMPDGTECDGGGDYFPACEEFVCTAGECTKTQFAPGTPCGVTDLCYSDRCNGSGGCFAVPIYECDDGNECTGDGCHPDDGCFFQASPGKPCGQSGYCKCPSQEACTGDNVWCEEP